jgi:hypothetical protein
LFRSSLEAGIGAGYYVQQVAVVKVEPWVVARVSYAQSLRDRDYRWRPRVSFGLTLGGKARPLKSLGVRVAGDCCENGLAVMGGVSRWF